MVWEEHEEPAGIRCFFVCLFVCLLVSSCPVPSRTQRETQTNLSDRKESSL